MILIFDLLFALAAPVKLPGRKCGGINTVTYEIMNRLPDKRGQQYPTRDKCYITVSESANSNADLTILYEKKVMFPTLGITDIDNFNHRVGALCDDFKGHSSKECKAFNLGTDEIKKNLKWMIMKGGLTPVGQPLDKVVNKVFKAFLRQLYDKYMLTAPVNPATGSPLPPTRQQTSTWVVEAWDLIPEELCAKAWTACGFKTKEDLASEKETAVTPYTIDQVGRMIENAIGEEIFNLVQDEASSGADPLFPEEEEGETETEDEEKEESSEEEEEKSDAEEEKSKEQEKESSEEESEGANGRRRRRSVGDWRNGPARFDRRKL